MRTVDERRARRPHRRQQQQMADGKVERPKQDKQRCFDKAQAISQSMGEWWRRLEESKEVKACDGHFVHCTLTVSGLDCW